MPRRPKNPDSPAYTGKYYLTNATLLPEVIKCKTDGKISDKLAKMLMLLTERYAKSSKFAGYTFRDDMVSEALINLCQNALKFNPEKSSNPFAFYTTAIHNSFLQYLNNEKKHRNIRDRMLVELGENPSFNYMANEKSDRSLSSDNVGLQEPEHYHEEITLISAEIVEANERKVISDAAALALAEQEKLTEEGIDVIIDKEVKTTEQFFKYEG